MHTAAMGSSLEGSTQSTGRSAVKAWDRYCKSLGANMLCMQGNEPYSISDTIFLIMGFASFEALRGISPLSTFNVYLPAIKNFYITSQISNNFSYAMKSEQVKFVERGYKKIYHKMHPISSSRKMAFTIELVNFVCAAFTNFDKESFDYWFIRARELALRTGIYFLLRKSEFLPNRNGTRSGLKRTNILFFDVEGYPIRNSVLHLGQSNSVRINIPFSKCDQFGKGRNLLHVRQSPGNRCIVTDLEKWIISTRDELSASDNDYLFKVKDRILISAEQVSLAMKKTAEFCGFDSKKISAHSLRYGGATMLAAAGLPQYIIAYFGGWCEDSKSLQIYTQLNIASNNRVSRIFSEGDKVSLEESRIRQTK
jgi:hypothetical protein